MTERPVTQCLGSVVTVVALLAGASGASAQTSTINACANQKTGVLRLLNAGQTCNKGETAVSWNQQGPMGVVGPQGPQGPEGPAGPTPIAQLPAHSSRA